jgi:hypothetical protein
MRLRIGSGLALAAVLALVYAYPSLTGRDTIGAQAAVVSVAWLACLAVLAGRGEGVYAPAVVYLGIFGLFHCGLLIAVALDESVTASLPMIGWLYNPYLARATTLVIVGMLAFTLGTVLVPPRADAGSKVAHQPTEPASARRVAGVVGVAVQLGGLGLLLLSIERVGGFGALADGYSALLLELNGSWTFAYGTLFTGIGTVLGVVAGGRLRLVAWAIFASYALLAFPLGTRGAVLFPLAVLVAIEARRGRRLRLPAAIAGVFVLFVLIAAVRTTRNNGVGGLLTGNWAAAPLEAVAEMGYSLRPSVVVLGWHAQGEPPRGGVTLVAVVVRLIERLTGWHGGPPALDDRLFNQEILTRAGPIGGSPIAEGFHNFGLIGVVAVMMVIGVVIGLLARRPVGLYPDALLGMVLVPLFVEIRNSFAVVIPQVALGLALLLVIRVLAGLLSTAHSPPPPVFVPRQPPRDRELVH